MSDVWPVVRKLKGHSNQSKISLPSKGGQFQNNSEIANQFSQIYKKVRSNHSIDANSLSSRNNTVAKTIRNIYLEKENLESTFNNDIQAINVCFTLNELDMALLKSNKNSALGINEILYNYFINSPDSMKIFLLDIINQSWTSGEIPLRWKHASVKPVIKPGKDKTDLNSYRPISLTNTISKVMEKMIVNRLRWYLEKNNLINNKQSGFRKTCSTNDPIIRLKTEAEHAVKSGNITIAILIDFSRAFDLLWIDGMLLKLMQFGITGNMLNWIKNFLTDRKYQVKIESSLSDPYILESGTPQGSSVSPLLYHNQKKQGTYRATLRSATF